MLNQIIIVGRIKEKGVQEENEFGKKYTNITLAVPRNFKNMEGEYDVDVIPVLLWDGIASNVNDWCNEGDIVGVKGRLQRLEGNTLQVVAEKVTFLSSKSQNKEEE